MCYLRRCVRAIIVAKMLVTHPLSNRMACYNPNFYPLSVLQIVTESSHWLGESDQGSLIHSHVKSNRVKGSMGMCFILS